MERDPHVDLGMLDPALPLRDAVARYVMERGPLIRDIARRKLTATAHAVCDSEEVLSSVLRRMDEMVVSRRLRPRSEAELWALIRAIASNTAVSKTRLVERARALIQSEGAWAHALQHSAEACATDDEATLLVHRMAEALPGGMDRQILTLMLRGASHRAIGQALGFSEDASRQRWMSIRRALASCMSSGRFDVH